MSATLNLYSLTLAHGDPTANNNPSLKFVDWKRAISGIEVQSPSSEQYSIAPGIEEEIFDGTRTTSIDGTTAFALSLNPLSGDLYRISYTGGTNPVLRTARTLDLSAIAQTLTAQANGSLLVASATGTPFSTLQVGDEVFIPGPLTGDAATVFNSVNQGRWSVLGVGSAGANVTLVRPTGEDFEGLSEVVTPASAGQFFAYSSAGVQPGDKVDISAGFATPVQRSFTVLEVTSTWIEFSSSLPLAAQSGVLPAAAGMKFYSNAKRYVRLEADQECVVRMNGDLDSTQKMSPWTAGDPALVAEYVKVGPTWSLKVLNRSSLTLTLHVITAE